MTQRIFLAHASPDKPRVRRLYTELKARGFDPWMDEIDLLPGQIWKPIIFEAIRQARVFVACLSGNSVSRTGFVHAEFRAALAAYAERPPDSLFLIPARLDECEIPDLKMPSCGLNLRDFQATDLWQPSGLDRLADAISHAFMTTGPQSPSNNNPVSPPSQQEECDVELPRDVPSILRSTVGLVETAYRKQSRISGVPTGIQDLNERLGGLQRCELIILAGRPSMGKTALAMTIAANAAATRAIGPDAEGLVSPNYTVVLFSFEISAEQLTMRLLAAEANFNSDDLRRGRLEENDFGELVRASQALAGRPLYIDDSPALSIDEIRSRARQIKSRHGLSLIVIDYLQLIRPFATTNQAHRDQEIAEITRGLKAIAKELNVPVLALSQVSRAVEQREDKRPQLADLSDSEAIDQDADVVMFIYREEYYQERAEPKRRDGETDDKFFQRYDTWLKRYEECRGVAELNIAKQRNGPIGPSIKLMFDGARLRFADLEYRDMALHGY